MADIELVIKIPEENYKKDNLIHFFGCYSEKLDEVIKNGTPLPKGHGDLIDRDAVNDRFDEIWKDANWCSCKPSDKYLLDKLSMCLDTESVVIEADKGE